MEYTSSLRIESATYPGVFYSIRKPSYGRVLEFDRENATYREKARAINKQSRGLQEQVQEHRKAWYAAQEAKLAAAKNADDKEAIARIEVGFEYERLIDLARRGTAEQRTELAATLLALPTDKETFAMDVDLLDAIRGLREASDALVAVEYNPQRLNWGLESIEELIIDGKPATAASLLAQGPPDLTAEVLDKIDEIASMTPEQLRNFGQPSTLQDLEGKATSDTTAIAA